MPRSHESPLFLTRPQSPDLSRARAIYEEAFPAAERKPWPQMQERWLAGHYEVAGLRAASSIQAGPAPLCALAFLLPLGEPNFLFLEYLAVDAAHRGQGMGSLLVRELLTGLACGRWQGMVCEIEPPDPPEAARQTGAGTARETDAVRRLRFYERLGGRLIPSSHTYGMPDMTRPGELLPLRLMEFPAGLVPGEREYAPLVQAIYRSAYPQHRELLPLILDLTR